MRRVLAGLIVMGLVAFGGTGCRKASAEPVAAAPSGTLNFYFTRKIEGPLELTLNGTRIPVERVGKKGFRQLLVTGLQPGKHRFYLSSPHESFGPDLGEIDLPAEKGVRLSVFAQSFKAVLYGAADPLPPAEGLPGIRAILQK